MGPDHVPLLQLDETSQVETVSEENKSLMWVLLRQLRPGMDLSRVVLPTFVLEPRSFLSKLSDYYYHGDLLSRCTSSRRAPHNPYGLQRQGVGWSKEEGSGGIASRTLPRGEGTPAVWDMQSPVCPRVELAPALSSYVANTLSLLLAYLEGWNRVSRSSVMSLPFSAKWVGVGMVGERVEFWGR